jgi:cation diffusion facilitator family transporter
MIRGCGMDSGIPSPPAVQASQDIRGLQLTLAAYIVIFVAKLAAYFASGVMVVLAEAMHTLSDILISGFLLIAAKYAQRQADETHMFGYSRAENVAALVAATLFVSFTSFQLYREAVPRLLKPEAPSYENLPIAIGVIVGSMVVAAVPLVMLFVRKASGAAARAQLLELVNDQLGLAAALLATLFVAWGYPLADPIGAIMVATLIAFNAVGLFRENASFLLGRSPGPQFLAEVERLALSVPGVVAVRDVRAEYVGPEAVHAGLRIEVQPSLPVEEAARIAHEVHRRVHSSTIHSGYCFVQIDAAKPSPAPAADSGRA